MKNIPDTLIERVVEKAFHAPDTPDKDTADFFVQMRKYNPEEMQSMADEVSVSVDELCQGMPVPALKFVAGDRDPFKIIEDYFQDPLTLLRISIARPISEEATRVFEEIGFEKTLELVTSIDVQTSTHRLGKAVFMIMAMYGFVEVDSWWRAVHEVGPGGPIARSEKLDHIQKLGNGKIALPFNDYELHREYTRGLDEVHLTAHHKTLQDALEGNYFARTIASNCILLDTIPLMGIDKVRREFSYGLPLRDPAALAFENGYAIDIGNGRYVYHLRLLVEGLTEKLSNPEIRYFFLRAAGLSDFPREPPDLKGYSNGLNAQLLKAERGQLLPDLDPDTAKRFETVCLGDLGKTEVDVLTYQPILNHPNSKRLKGIRTLSNLANTRIGYATQSRLEHSIGVLHFARAICNRVGIKGYDRIKVEVHALTHDWGHLTGSHASESYFHASSGFNHEDFAAKQVRDSKEVFDGIVDVEDIVAMIEHKDPLHVIVDGPFGADRIYYALVDPFMCGEERSFDPLSILSFVVWNGTDLFLTSEKIAYDFLKNRAELYEKFYLHPSTQISDAYLRKMLFAAGIKSPFDKVVVKNNYGINVVPGEQAEIEFWQMIDTLLEYHLANHPDRDVSEPMRHLGLVYHKAPHATVAVIKNKGYEDEPRVEIPFYKKLTMKEIKPLAYGAEQSVLARYLDAADSPQNIDRLESEVARRMNIPKRHVIATSLPFLSKIASEYSPVLKDGELVSVFDDEEYRRSMIERANAVSCLRIAVHPQLYAHAYLFFKEHPFDKIVEEVLGDE